MTNLKILILSLFSVVFTFSAFSDDALRFGGYLRTGTGINGWGEDHVCPKISGVPGNFMRLGNECGTYGEMAFSYSPQKAWEKTDRPYQIMNVNFAISEPGHTNYEGSSASDGTGKFSMSMVESYLLLGNIFTNKNIKLWIGKRWYRETDIHILDWFHWAEMNGVGTGIRGIDLGPGSLSVALLNGPTTPSSTIGVSTKGSDGTVSKKVIDVRYLDLDIGFGSLDTWAAVGFNKAGRTVDTASAGDAEYDSNTGFVFGIRHKFDYKLGSNDFGVAYATGNMESMSMSFNVSNTLKDVASTKVNKYNDAKRTRVFNQGKLVFGNLEILHALAWDSSEYGPAKVAKGSTTVTDKESFFVAAARPVYFFSDHFSLATELGWVTFDKEESSVNRLTRFTLAPQFHLSKGIWGRPVLRFYVSQSMVNSAVAPSVASNVGIIGSPETYSNYGVQFESWF